MATPTEPTLPVTYCPICTRALRPGELLMSKWYEPKQWQVLYHLRPLTEAEAADPDTYVDFAEDNGKARYKTYCCVADGAHLPMSAHDKALMLS